MSSTMGDITHTDFDDADVIRACTRKTGYPSERVGKLAILSIRQRNPSAELRAYACRRCGMWHVGGTPISERTFAQQDSPDEELERMRKRYRRPRRRAYGTSSGRRPRDHRDDAWGDD